MLPTPSPQPQPPAPLADAPASARAQTLRFVLVLARRKRLLFGFPLIVGVLALAATFLLPDVYTATAKLMPPVQTSSSALSLLNQLGPIGNLGAGSLGLKNPSDLYVGMLKSRTVADALIQRFDLQKLYDEDNLVETRKALEEVTSITTGRDGLISIAVDDRDPERAAAMANGYAEELDRLTGSLAVSEAAQRRAHFERQLAGVKADLAEAEAALRQSQETSGLIQLDEQAKAVIGAIAGLKAQVIAKEVEVGTMRSFATEQHPDYVRARRQLAGLREELAALQRKHAAAAGGEAIPPAGSLPASGLEYLRRLREVKYQEALFEFLARQVEMARIDESKEGLVVQFVDKALPPDRRSKPARALIALLAVAVAGVAAAAVTFALELLEAAAREPGERRLVAEIGRHLGLRERDAQGRDALGQE